MRRLLAKTFCLIAVTIISVCIFGNMVKADSNTPVDISVSVDGGANVTAHGVFVSYEDNLYISLVDMQNLLKGTAKEFDFYIEDGAIYIITEDITDMTERDREISGWSDEEKAGFDINAASMNTMYVNDIEKRYATIMTTLGGYKEIFIHVCDFCLIRDIEISRDNLSLSINTNEKMKPVNPKQLEGIGFFQGINTVLVGDATTGEIFYEYNGDEVFPIASTTKLMTYLLMEEAVQNGKISYDDQVTVTKEAEIMSKTSDGIIPMKEGQTVPLRELISAALIISSNECDHMVSVHFAGDEETAVEMMNNKAKELSMTTAEFYNCNGLPIYTNSLFPAKKQNRMSSKDMFTMASYILNKYPQVKDITSAQFMTLDVLNKDMKNTNPVLFNLPECTGLKTGTTNKSGACLVASITVNDGSMDHDIVVVEFGAETSADRGRVTELMARFGKAVVLNEASKYEETVISEPQHSLTADGIVNMIVNKAMMNK